MCITALVRPSASKLASTRRPLRAPRASPALLHELALRGHEPRGWSGPHNLALITSPSVTGSAVRCLLREARAALWHSLRAPVRLGRMPASWIPKIGDEFAAYRLEEMIGHGGMSIVYRARHRRARALRRPQAPVARAERRPGLPGPLHPRVTAGGRARPPQRDPDLRGRRGERRLLHRNAIRPGLEPEGNCCSATGHSIERRRSPSSARSQARSTPRTRWASCIGT